MGMLKAYRIVLFAVQQTFYKKKNFVLIISIHLNKHNIEYFKDNDWDGTKLRFLRVTHSRELRYTVYLCGLELKYDKEYTSLQ